ncbi:hypothetical protein B0H17DRAFT_1140007 [Mycena rosella]|uniref:Uncharacterized protein n=1 Tax=Mycena rosella TaxID=1033263 RepID=A0AAD7D6P7_MYCRO|nr:hypothetical protein B0H17DRAFT_1140007 [Mycena rosella]
MREAVENRTWYNTRPSTWTHRPFLEPIVDLDLRERLQGSTRKRSSRMITAPRFSEKIPGREAMRTPVTTALPWGNRWRSERWGVQAGGPLVTVPDGRRTRARARVGGNDEEEGTSDNSSVKESTKATLNRATVEKMEVVSKRHRWLCSVAGISAAARKFSIVPIVLEKLHYAKTPNPRLQPPSPPSPELVRTVAGAWGPTSVGHVFNLCARKAAALEQHAPLLALFVW